MEKKWYAVIDGKRHGPMTTVAINNIKKSGKIDDRTFVWCQGMDNWTQLKDVLELADVKAEIREPLSEFKSEEPEKQIIESKQKVRDGRNEVRDEDKNDQYEPQSVDQSVLHKEQEPITGKLASSGHDRKKAVKQGVVGCMAIFGILFVIGFTVKSCFFSESDTGGGSIDNENERQKNSVKIDFSIGNKEIEKKVEILLGEIASIEKTFSTKKEVDKFLANAGNIRGKGLEDLRTACVDELKKYNKKNRDLLEPNARKFKEITGPLEVEIKNLKQRISRRERELKFISMKVKDYEDNKYMGWDDVGEMNVIVITKKETEVGGYLQGYFRKSGKTYGKNAFGVDVPVFIFKDDETYYKLSLELEKKSEEYNALQSAFKNTIYSLDEKIRRYMGIAVQKITRTYIENVEKVFMINNIEPLFEKTGIGFSTSVVHGWSYIHLDVAKIMAAPINENNYGTTMLLREIDYIFEDTDTITKQPFYGAVTVLKSGYLTENNLDLPIYPGSSRLIELRLYSCDLNYSDAFSDLVDMNDRDVNNKYKLKRESKLVSILRTNDSMDNVESFYEKDLSNFDRSGSSDNLKRFTMLTDSGILFSPLIIYKLESNSEIYIFLIKDLPADYVELTTHDLVYGTWKN